MAGVPPIRLVGATSWRREPPLAADPAIEEGMSLQRHIAMLRAPLAVSHGTCETPELRRSAIAVTVAVDTAGHHQDMRESLGNPHGINGRAALAMMELPA